MRSVTNFIHYQILIRYQIKEKEMDGACSTCGERNPREIDHLEDQSLEGRVILKWIIKNFNGKAWTGLIWLRKETSSGILWSR